MTDEENLQIELNQHLFVAKVKEREERRKEWIKNGYMMDKEELNHEEYKYFDKYPELDDIPVFRRGQYLRQLDKMPEEHHNAAINAFLQHEAAIEFKERERTERNQAIDAAREKLVAHLKQASLNGKAK